MLAQDKEKTAFATPKGGCIRKMSCLLPVWILQCSSDVLENHIKSVLSGLQWNKAVLNFDDIIVYGKSFDEHLENFKQVVDIL